MRFVNVLRSFVRGHIRIDFRRFQILVGDSCQDRGHLERYLVEIGRLGIRDSRGWFRGSRDWFQGGHDYLKGGHGWFQGGYDWFQEGHNCF